jgi:protein ImuB
MASNPERIEAGWWSETQTRDYFIAEGQDHTLYWGVSRAHRRRCRGCRPEMVPAWFVRVRFNA